MYVCKVISVYTMMEYGVEAQLHSLSASTQMGVSGQVHSTTLPNAVAPVRICIRDLAGCTASLDSSARRETCFSRQESNHDSTVQPVVSSLYRPRYPGSSRSLRTVYISSHVYVFFPLQCSLPTLRSLHAPLILYSLI